MNCSMEPSEENKCAIRRPAASHRRAVKKHMRLNAEGAHTAMHAQAGRTSDEQLLVLPSLKKSCGKLVAPELKEDTTAHLR